MSYFPTDIPFMSEKELRENGIKIPKTEAANEVVKFAEDVLHIELLPWQKYFIANVLAIGVTKDAEGSEERGVTTVEKLKAYEEQQKADKIVVGDEVKCRADDCGVVTWIYGSDAYVLWQDGSTGNYAADELVKTGRHFNFLASLLEAMKEGAK